MAITPEQLSGADDKVLEELNRSAESMLQAQLALSTAADARAVAFSSVIAAAAAGLVAAGVTLILASDDGMRPFGVVALSVAAGLLLSMIVAMCGARSIRMTAPGNQPDAFEEELARGTTAREIQSINLCFFNQGIEDNFKGMKRNGRLMNGAMLIAAVSLIAGFVTCLFLLFPVPTPC
ncbi:hypothetical protein [Terrihabitans rhizophilus]|uniref:Phage holin family protein n=1 Tax=Terrihabitans rhizophilus TaxID=3092662 RepID=A0ABU4RQ58_9HYPH|nr:hypothetical protein [Terrihabitans sp. PJ23]MDX6806328.1 hypothetical protein [Terrihabitans sp. PJ23]